MPRTTTAPVSEATRGPRPAYRVGGWLLWFATLGGSVMWATHLMLAWSAVELVCGWPADPLTGLSVRAFVWLVTVIPGVIGLAALVAAGWLRTRRLAGASPDRAVARARFMVTVGFFANLFAVLMLVFDGAAVVVFVPCGS